MMQKAKTAEGRKLLALGCQMRKPFTTLLHVRIIFSTERWRLDLPAFLVSWIFLFALSATAYPQALTGWMCYCGCCYTKKNPDNGMCEGDVNLGLMILDDIAQCTGNPPSDTEYCDAQCAIAAPAICAAPLWVTACARVPHNAARPILPRVLRRAPAPH